jgi:P22_AR N-terminal domain
MHIVPFYGDEIHTFENEGGRYVAMRRIVENMGLNWSGQHTKLLDQKKKLSCMDIHTTASNGKSYQMLAMPVEKLPLWLASMGSADDLFKTAR